MWNVIYHFGSWWRHTLISWLLRTGKNTWLPNQLTRTEQRKGERKHSTASLREWPLQSHLHFVVQRSHSPLLSCRYRFTDDEDEWSGSGSGSGDGLPFYPPYYRGLLRLYTDPDDTKHLFLYFQCFISLSNIIFVCLFRNNKGTDRHWRRIRPRRHQDHRQWWQRRLPRDRLRQRFKHSALHSLH